MKKIRKIRILDLCFPVTCSACDLLQTDHWTDTANLTTCYGLDIFDTDFSRLGCQGAGTRPGVPGPSWRPEIACRVGDSK